MKKLILLGTIGLFVLGCSQKPEEVVTQENEQIVEIEETIPKIALADFETEAGNFVSQEIEISGLVDHVCKHGGKKLLLVVDGAQVHVVSEERFNEDLIGTSVSLVGIVNETVVDEAKCLEMEENNISKHKEGENNEENFKLKQQQIQAYRDSMAVAGIDHLSFYDLNFVSFVE